MVFKYIKVEKNYKRIALLLLTISIAVLLIGGFGKETLLASVFGLFGAMFFYTLNMYFRKFSLVTEDDGIQINYFFKTVGCQWSEIISVKKSAPAPFRLTTKKGSLRFNPYGLLPVTFNSEEEATAGRNAETVLLQEIAQKAPQVKFVNIPKELLELKEK